MAQDTCNLKKEENCRWTRAFDQHFNISCNSGERANCNFKGVSKGANWEFIFCPYCGKKIIEIEE